MYFVGWGGESHNERRGRKGKRDDESKRRRRKKKKGNWTDNTIDRFVTTYSIIREQYYLI